MANETKVTRIKATDSPKRTAKTMEAPLKEDKKRMKRSRSANVFVRIGGYFKGAWVELRQVRWPNRRSTWGLTLAVILFSAFFVVLILLLDVLFKYIFEIILT